MIKDTEMIFGVDLLRWDWKPSGRAKCRHIIKGYKMAKGTYSFMLRVNEMSSSLEKSRIRKW